MTKAQTPDEKPKATVAKRVIAPKRRYFTPEGHSVEAKDLDGALIQVKKLTNTVEDGDGK